MPKKLILLAVPVVLVGGWMLFDGLHAFVTGDYVTPSSGEYAGQLGPWAPVVSAVGLEPRSTLVKSIFVGYGVGYLVTLLTYLRGRQETQRRVLLVIAAAGLWYLPVGTLLNAVVVGLLSSRAFRTTAAP